MSIFIKRKIGRKVEERRIENLGIFIISIFALYEIICLGDAAGVFMGLIRLVLIFISIAVIAEIPADDGVSLFRSIFAFYIMLILDYVKILYRDKQKKDFGFFVGGAGLISCLVFSGISLLGLFKQLVLTVENGAYFVTNSKTFMLFPFHVNLQSYIQFSAVVTLGVALLEIFISKEKTEPKSELAATGKRKQTPLDSTIHEASQSSQEVVVELDKAKTAK
ncbi:hypothetical protein D478_14815 [Brevibacillus agri BAB-2500]|nr:hypothetical protein D478_14815 [Brevibacillus agri BAB-2500]